MKHNRLRVLLGAAALLLSAAVAPSGIVFHGTVPLDLDKAFLIREHRRLDSLLNTEAVPNSNPIVAIYYGQGNRPPLAARLPEWGGGGAVGSDTSITRKPLCQAAT